MLVEVLGSVEPLVAVMTCILLLSVCLHVIVEVAFLQESHATHIALEWATGVVHCKVVLQVALTRKGHVTHSANVFSFWGRARD